MWFSIELASFNSHTQVIFKGLFDQKLALLFFKEKEGSVLRMSCRNIETTVKELFSRFGWSSTKRIKV